MSTAARLLSAAVDLVHRRPCAPLGLALGQPALLVPFFDVLRLTLLFVGVLLLASAWHNSAPPRASRIQARCQTTNSCATRSPRLPTAAAKRSAARPQPS